MTNGSKILTIFRRINLPNFVQAYRYDSSREGSDGVIFTRPRKCRYDISSHTVPLRALLMISTVNAVICCLQLAETRLEDAGRVGSWTSPAVPATVATSLPRSVVKRWWRREGSR